MTTLTKAQSVELEKLIDATSLADVCEALSQIAYGKSEHVQSVWQDHNAAGEWDSAAKRFRTLATVFHGRI